MEDTGEREDKYCLQIPEERAGDEIKHKSSDKMLAAADPSVPRDKAIRIGLDAGKHVKGDARSRVRSCPTTSSFSVKC